MVYSDLRKGRVSQPNRAYFVTTVTYKRHPFFADIYCARLLVRNMKQLHDAECVESMSWVIMPDHLHWLFCLRNSNSLPLVMKKLKAVSARQINQRLNTTGTVWQKAYYDRAIRDGEDLRKLARYIVANPLRAGLVSDISCYSHWDAAWL